MVKVGFQHCQPNGMPARYPGSLNLADLVAVIDPKPPTHKQMRLVGIDVEVASPRRCVACSLFPIPSLPGSLMWAALWPIRDLLASLANCSAPISESGAAVPPQLCRGYLNEVDTYSPPLTICSRAIRGQTVVLM